MTRIQQFSIVKPFAFLLLLAALALLTQCAGQPGSGIATDTLIYARGGDAVTLDPGSMEDGLSANVATQIYEGLVRFKPGSLDIEPCLATSWETSRDKKTWTFQLREGVTFHDGTPFTSEAVVMSFQRQMDSDHPYHMAGRMPYAEFVFAGIVKDVRAADEHTVQIELFKPYAPLLKNLAMFCTYIISPEALKKHGEDIGANPVGTGPFQFSKWQRDVEVTLERYPGYWGEPAETKRLVYKTIRDPDVRLISLARGEAHLMDGIEPQMVSEVDKHGHLQLVRHTGVNLGYAAINTKREPFTDKRVRQALNYAVNKKAICEYLFEGLAVPCRGIFPPGIMGYDPDSDAYEYNPEKAKELLKEAGYEEGFSFELLSYSVPRPYNPMGARLAEVIQSDLSKVGIYAQPVQVEWGTLLQRTLNHNYSVSLIGWITDNGDPDNYAYALLAYPGNRSQFAHPLFNQLVQKAQETYDEEARLRYYKKAQQIALEEAPWIFLNHFEDLAVVTNRVQNFNLHPSGLHQMWDVAIGIPNNTEDPE